MDLSWRQFPAPALQQRASSFDDSPIHASSLPGTPGPNENEAGGLEWSTCTAALVFGCELLGGRRNKYSKGGTIQVG
jgi:hypothetical protein